jgi:hypothetical protein
MERQNVSLNHGIPRSFSSNRLSPHEALGMKYPVEIYQPSTRLHQGLPDIDYPLHDKISS